VLGLEAMLLDELVLAELLEVARSPDPELVSERRDAPNREGQRAEKALQVGHCGGAVVRSRDGGRHLRFGFGLGLGGWNHGIHGRSGGL